MGQTHSVTSEAFWDLIESTRPKRYDAEAHAEKLTETLAKLSTEEVLAFDRLFQERVNEAYRWDLWGAAYVMAGGCSDDGFEYFRRWLIGQGRAVYEAALADPESLAGVKASEDDEFEAESLGYAAASVLEKHGVEPESIPLRDQPEGEPWDEDDLESLFPKLSKKYG